MRKLLAIFVLLCAPAWAADTTPSYIPNSATAVTTSTVRIYTLYLANNTAGALTVTILDRSTNCNSAGCPLWPTVSIAANSVYTAQLSGVPATTGFTWQASAANSVMGWISYQ